MCDNIAPVVESYLSLEAIAQLREYNEKLDVVNTLEIDGKYDEMLDEALNAMAVYHENRLAVKKAKHALKRIQQNNLAEQLRSLLNEAMGKKNYGVASNIIKIADLLLLSDELIDSIRPKLKLKILNIKEVDAYLDSSFNAIIECNTNLASEIVEEGLLKHTSSKRLKKRREDIKKFVTKKKEIESKKEIKQKSGIPRKERQNIVMQEDNCDMIDYSIPIKNIPKITRK
ncbi:MAG: hypothetical protein K2K75_12545 [Muribaculaceae bacterium]|nr:hypothetical protein [Muribaculaceae bacterium]